jgi:formiminotetrahydrofolate cyclodeaminase
MSDDLMDLPLRQLLEKFAAGKHKPGSGSAVALLGLISCALSRTVIALTDGKEKYADVQGELNEILSELRERIQPLLEDAFVADSISFDRVIKARNHRDEAKDHAEWWKRSHLALNELDRASSIALNIANNCLKLSELAINIFDKGFKSAQGDSEVAIEAALAGAKGALSVVYLNLKDFRGEEHAKKTLDEAEQLAIAAKALQTKLDERMEKLRKRAIKRNASVSLNKQKLLCNNNRQSRYSKHDLQQIVKNLHSELWLNRNQIWTTKAQLLPMEIVSPAMTFSLCDYSYEEVVTLGQDLIDTESIEIAGYVDNEAKVAKISKKFPLEVRRFTAAHELGHAILHGEGTLFRDRALDGGHVGTKRPAIEREADIFATLFLMPERQVRDIFFAIFGTEKFELSQGSAFAIGFEGLAHMKTKLPTVRHVSTHLSTTAFFAGVPQRSLCEIFGVSKSAMAIRIEELSLI